MRTAVQRHGTVEILSYLDHETVMWRWDNKSAYYVSPVSIFQRSTGLWDFTNTNGPPAKKLGDLSESDWQWIKDHPEAALLRYVLL